ncbi:MAG: hypothetical protein V7L20_18720 [Nostoc sp.]
MREAVGTGSPGTSLVGLRRGAETLGFNMQTKIPLILNFSIQTMRT